MLAIEARRSHRSSGITVFATCFDDVIAFAAADDDNDDDDNNSNSSIMLIVVTARETRALCVNLRSGSTSDDPPIFLLHLDRWCIRPS
jgi:hypothetical protein